MFYEKELAFFRRTLANIRIDSVIISDNLPLPSKIDRGLRDFLGFQKEYNQRFGNLINSIEKNTVYQATDPFLCSYIVIPLPDTETKSALIAGPYLKGNIRREQLMESAEKYDFPPLLFSELEKYYANLPVITQEDILVALYESFAETVWGSDNYSVKSIGSERAENLSISTMNAFKEKSDDSLLTIRALEDKYNAERKLMQAVSRGSSVKAEQMISKVSDTVLESRTNDPLRNMQNYMIVLNTLLRKAAEQGGVHPFYIDSLSSDFAKKIETVKTIAECISMMKDMVGKYSLLVKEHSAKNYASPVQKVMTIIDSDLMADLSLKNLSSVLNVNPSYLSSLFKKETGTTLTEYVSKKRIDYAAFLLRTTSLQVQTIAQHCGVFDVNYFTKMFKKQTGKTPKEYRG